MGRKEEGGGNFKSPRQAARILGIDRHSVYRRIWARKLRAFKRGHDWLIPSSCLT